MKLFLLKWMLWPFLMCTWELVSKKRSHWWHWQEYGGQINRQKCVFVAGDTSAKSRTTRWSNLWQTNFGWKRVSVMEVPRSCQAFRAGFIDANGTAHVCTWTQKKVRKFAMLLGPDDGIFFALDEYGDQVPLDFLAFATKRSLPRSIRLL